MTGGPANPPKVPSEPESKKIVVGPMQPMAPGPAPAPQKPAPEEQKIATAAQPLPQMPPAKSPSPPPVGKPSMPFQSILLRTTPGRSASPMRPEKQNVSVFDMLEISKNNRPQPQDSLVVSPSNPVPFKKLPVQFPTVPMLISPEILSKFEDDTLFFMFYYQQGTYEQYLAVKELKRREWVYHMKYMTWFHKYEDPKTGKSDEKTYLYFDYESGWCQRIKGGFEFEPRYMENEMIP